MALPRCGAGQWLTGSTEGNVRCDYREDKPRGQEPPPVKFGSKVERNYPHLEQSHQLQDSKVCALEHSCSPDHHQTVQTQKHKHITSNF